MVTDDLGACDGFVWELRRSNLLDRGQLDQVVGEFLKRNPRAEPNALADYLVGQNILSAFQAERILQGKSLGLVLGPYNILDAIGAGSMGQVYKASSKTDSNWYAVKVLPRRSMWNVRLARRQARAFGTFSHPAVVPFMDVGTSGGMTYLVWPLVEGETLDSLILREGKLSAGHTARVGLQIAQGLNVCHQNGLFHGLLKPSNVMIGPDGQARILDFGIGSLLVENEGGSLVDTMSTANALTSGLDCASPESILEPTNLTPAGDQYSLGCVLYCCLTGKVPFPEGNAVEKMIAQQFKQPTPVKELAPGTPDGLVQVVEKLMQKSPEGRYAGCDEVVVALQPLAGPTPIPAAVKPAAVKPAPPADPPRLSNNGPAPEAPTPSGPRANVLGRLRRIFGRLPSPYPSPAVGATLPPGPGKRGAPQIGPWAFLRSMAVIAWRSFRHPLRTTVVDLSTGRVVKEY